MGAEQALVPGQLADDGACRGVIGDLLGNDVTGSRQGLGNGVDLELRVDKGCGKHFGGRTSFAAAQHLCQRFETAFPGNQGFGPTFLLVGEVEVF